MRHNAELLDDTNPQDERTNRSAARAGRALLAQLPTSDPSDSSDHSDSYIEDWSDSPTHHDPTDSNETVENW
jgi:hypothetical protein